jgi:protoporphyrinogen oxidase
MYHPRIAVIGAGASGLSCAYELQKSGAAVIVFEARPYVGGRMATRTKQDLPFDIGADHLCNLYDDMKAYAQEFGLTFEPMRFSNYGLFRGGRVLPIDSSVSIRSRLKLLWDQRGPRRVKDFFNLSNAAPFDTEDGDTYGRAHFGDEITDYLVDPFVSTYQFHRAKEISSGAFIAILESLRFDNGKWKLHQLRGGMSALPEAFAERLTVQTGTPVLRVAPSEDGVLVTTKDGSEPYDAVVLACTASVSARIFEHPTKAQADLLASTTYASSISIAFRVKPPHIPPHSVVWVPYIESQKISGYTNQTMKQGSFTNAAGESLLCTWLHEAFAKTLLHASDEEIFQIVKHELVRVCPHLGSEDALTPYDIERWDEAMPKFSAGHLKRVDTFLQHHQGEQNVYFCGDFMNSLWTEGSLRGGKRTASLIMQRFSREDAPGPRE